MHHIHVHTRTLPQDFNEVHIKVICNIEGI